MTLDKDNLHRYEAIIDMPHHISRHYPQMTVHNRAAQFAPFAALTGYNEAVNETARRTVQRIILDENSKVFLDEKLQMIQQHLKEHPQVTVTYFKSDVKKSGGAYLTVSGQVRKLDRYTSAVLLQEGMEIPIEDIVDIQGELFRFWE